MSVFMAGILQRQTHVAKGIYSDSAIESRILFNRANLPQAGFHFCISGGLVRKWSCVYTRPRARRVSCRLGEGTFLLPCYTKWQRQDVFHRGQEAPCYTTTRSHAALPVFPPPTHKRVLVSATLYFKGPHTNILQKRIKTSRVRPCIVLDQLIRLEKGASGTQSLHPGSRKAINRKLNTGQKQLLLLQPNYVN